MAIEYNEKDLEDIIEEMGVGVDGHIDFRKLKKEMDRFLNENDEYSGGSANESLFSSLDIDPAPSLNMYESRTPKKTYQDDYLPSPIVSRRTRGGKFQDYENLSCSDEFKSISSKPEVSELIAHAHSTLARVYNTCRGVTQVVDSIQQHDDLEEVDSYILDEDEYDEDEEEYEDDLETESAPVSVGTQSRKPTKKPMTVMDPSVRKVRSPKPGQARYKFDPVTRHQLYREEWARHPTPGESKRLAIRWKVRDFMLRHDLPKLTQNSNQKVTHPKAWSPAPYLN